MCDGSDTLNEISWKRFFYIRQQVPVLPLPFPLAAMSTGNFPIFYNLDSLSLPVISV